MGRISMRTFWVVALIVVNSPAWAQELYPTMPTPGTPIRQGLDSPSMPRQALPAPGLSAGLPAGSTVAAPIGQQFAYPGWPDGTGAASLRPAAPAPVLTERLIESNWYTRVDYFHWNERLDGADFVNEDGVLLTLGYVRRVGVERFRAELFGGNMHYDGSAQYDDGSSEPLSSRTDYLGVRGEYDLLFEPKSWPAITFLAGIGTRFWVRDLRDGVTDLDNPVMGYQETWWTIYPYLGVEKRRVLADGGEFYGGGRIGLTAITLEHVSFEDIVLYPKPGILGQLEGGIRGRHLFLAAFFEAMTWGESNVVRDALQPASRMFTAGLKTGFSF